MTSTNASPDWRGSCDLQDFLDRQSGQLSAGQKTRVALAKALINTPDVLLLDEPTASLDPDTADWVRTRLERYREEHRATILLASHNMPEVERLCDDVLMMKTGRIVDHGVAGGADRPATAARRWRTCSSTSRAAAATDARPTGATRPRNERRPGDFDRRALPFLLAPQGRRHGAPPLVSAALFLAAHRRPHLLAGGADADVGVPAALPHRASRAGSSQVGGAFIGAVLLWDILFRGQIGFSISFLEELWSRNLGNLMMTPLRPVELVAALMAMSVVRVLIGLVPVSFLAIVFFGFNFWQLGLAVIAFFFNLILTSWSIGLISSGMVLKKGLGAEGLAWSLTFVLLPLCCVYYPVSVLPDWLQWWRSRCRRRMSSKGFGRSSSTACSTGGRW